MRITECGEAEKDELAALMTEFFSEEEHRGLLAAEAIPARIDAALKLRARGVWPLLLSEEGGRVGYMFGSSLYSNEYGGFLFFLDEFMIAPAARGKGRGARALEALEHWCAERGFCGIMLETMKTNSRVRGFYSRCGFRVSDRVVMHRFF